MSSGIRLTDSETTSTPHGDRGQPANHELIEPPQSDWSEKPLSSLKITIQLDGRIEPQTKNRLYKAIEDAIALNCKGCVATWTPEEKF